MTFECIQCKKIFLSHTHYVLHMRFQHEQLLEPQKILIKSENETIDNVCKICFVNKPKALFYPCGHSQFCLDCANKVFYQSGHCPICRSNTKDVVEIFT